MALTEEQALCVRTLDRPLVVAAGAGSGKTFTLTQRIVGALENGFVDDIGEVCAITFTKKAAGELKSRIKGELRARGLVDQALKVDEAWVSTIHGMCARILRAHAIELGIDPAFEVAEGATVDSFLAQAVDAVLAEADGDSSRRVDALFGEYPARSFGYGASIESMLTDLVVAASSSAEGTGSFVLPGATMGARQAVEAVIETVEELLALAAGEKASPKRDEWIAATGDVLARLREAIDAGEFNVGMLLSALAPLKLAKTFGSKDYKARVDEARAAVGANTMELRLGMAGEYLETLVDLADRALVEFRRLKRADGVLDNNDLLVMAARALEEHPSIAARYSDKFKLIMVDEFQDTDQMQVDMIKRLAGEGAERLCTVGDAQQSIYRFRGADVSVYRRHLASVQRDWGDGSVVKLALNFRSHPDVLSFVDCVFGRSAMFGGEFMPLSAPEGAEAKHNFKGSERVSVQHVTTPWSGVTADEACEQSARGIARKFARLKEAGHSAGDMVVLLGRMTRAEAYARALRDEGLPCVIAGGSVFSKSAEAAVIRALVRVVANPLETQSLFNVLVGPMFGVSAGDLLRIGGVGNFWKAAFAGDDAVAVADAGVYANAGAGPDVDVIEASPALACAFEVLRQVRRDAGLEATWRVVERAVTDSGWLSRLEKNGAEGLASAGNVFKAIRMIRDIESAGAPGPASVMRQLEVTLDSSKEAPGALLVSGGNSVRIMTVHASKGLEFPIVAVAEFKDDRASSGKLLSATIGDKTYLSLDLGASADDGFTVDLELVRDYVLGEAAGEDELASAVAEEAGALHRRLALGEYDAAGEAEEAKRLLYVAITRAKEAVLVSTRGKRTKADPFGLPRNVFAGVFEGLDPVGGALGEGSSQIDFGGSQPAVVECVALKPGDDDATAEGVGGGAVGNGAGGGWADVADGERAPGGENLEGGDNEPATFMIPVVEERRSPAFEAWRPLREGVFSYSSISDASHEGGLLDRLAGEYAVSVDDPAAVGAEGEDDVASAELDAELPCGGRANNEASGPSIDRLDEDGRLIANPSEAFDGDRATYLGTAFHRLAQFAVVSRVGAGPLVRPPADRVEAFARTCDLDFGQRARLAAALDRWFASDLAADMAALPQLSAEVPFFVSVGDAFLEGEIDLLGFDDSGRHVYVVDYKTGGSADEAIDDLLRKHVLQAACYAYAVLLQGAESVDATFARVERPRADGQPQCVRYLFSANDLPALRDAIAEAHALV